MPVVWLLRYANRTSNLKTALTRKYRINQVCEYQRTLFLNKIVYFFMYSKNEKDYLYVQTIVLNYPLLC